MISLETAQRLILESCAALATEDVSIEHATGRVLAETLHASNDLVPYARSAMDGYAVRAGDTAPSGVLAVRERIYAEASGERSHAAGTATEIATGAPIPLGADAVIPSEDVQRENGIIRFQQGVAPGTHVFPPGEDARTGDVLVDAGTKLTPPRAALLAAAGHARVTVVRKPRVAIVTTGDELVAPHDEPHHGQIRDSNAVVVAATVAAWGCDVVRRTKAVDDAGTLREQLRDAMEASDLVITTGGASVGERDLVKPLFKELGCAFAFESLALRPAKPTGFATRGRARVAVLPGNPSSAFVALHELARVAALALGGHSDVRLPRVRSVLDGSVHGKAERTFAVYAVLRMVDGTLRATPLGNQCSALTRTAADANGFIVIPPGKRDYGFGEPVDFDVVDWT